MPATETITDVEVHPDDNLQASVAKRCESLATLLCGQKCESKCDINEILNHLHESICTICGEISKLPERDDRHLTLYGPFLGRSLLELGATALIGRIDPFRVLILREAQKQPNYNIGKQHAASIRWQGDVVDENVADLWNDKSLKSPTRALLGVYQRHFFRKVMDEVADKLSSSEGGNWSQKLTSMPPDSIPHYAMNEILRLYSSLSKGIHHELIVPVESLLDRDTIKTLLNETLQVMATVGLMTSFVPHVYNSAEERKLLECFNDSQFLEID